MTVVYTTDASYSPDVEINERGKVVYARDIKRGDRISIPLHMMKHIKQQSR
jgi:hypothetical protein